jgi:hypothetical protein
MDQEKLMAFEIYLDLSGEIPSSWLRRANGILGITVDVRPKGSDIPVGYLKPVRF